MKNFLNRFKFIFDLKKKVSPVFYALFYHMQHIFFETVVVGGILSDKRISAKLLHHYLVPFGKEIEDLVISDGELINVTTDNEAFKKKINEAIDKFGYDGYFNTDNISKNKFNSNLTFYNSDLFYFFHHTRIIIVGRKNIYNSWTLDIKLNDTYDFTDLKNLGEYFTSNNSKVTSVLSSILNNYSVISSQYGVIKPYDITIKIKMIDYKRK